MARTESHIVPLHTQAPDFTLLDTVDEQHKSLASLKGSKGTLVIFICNHCPYVVHLLDGVVSIAKELQSEGIATIGISSNNVESYPQDGPEFMKQLAVEKEFGFPYLYDPTQEVAKAYQVACTPDFYLFDSHLKLYYHGRFDASRPGNEVPVSGNDLRASAHALLAQKPHLEVQYPSMGCNIKWLPGNEPNF